MKRIVFALVLTAVCLASCKSTGSVLPNVSGKAGEVMVVIDKSAWDSELGVAVRELLACDCPWLPQKEPLYSLVNVPPSGFADLFKIHRNIVWFNIDPQVQEHGMELRSDLWAHPQCVIRINAATAEEAREILSQKGATLVEAIEQAERDRVVANTLRYENRELYPQVVEIMGGSPHFPSGYKLKKKTSDFVWIADEKQYTMQGILIYKYPVGGGSDEFSWEKIVEHRNAAMKANVPGMFDGTYMTTSEFTVPMLRYASYKGRKFAEARGLWEVHDDYMGGPFVSHSFYTPDGKYILVTEAFVYAPKYDKRQYLRQVESILYSFEWKKDGE
ncbi:MAG: DUF4837 family protein [Bacteroidales bacterium]|nr:DUF4837 family protein [Bacteroidales bacterium]